VARLVLVTSKPERFAVPIVARLGLDRWLEAVVAPSLDRRAEPKAVTLSRALTTVTPDVDPSATVMVGDRSHDVLAGQACGTRTIGVTWGAGSRAELAAAGADRIVDTPAELVAALT
jgi:phosphoglycolate phosphatase